MLYEKKMSEPIGPSTFFCLSTLKIDATRVPATLCIAFLPSLKYGFIRARFLIPGALFHACDQIKPCHSSQCCPLCKGFARCMTEWRHRVIQSIFSYIWVEWMTQFQSVGVNGYQEIKCRKLTDAMCDHDIARQQSLFHIWMYFFYLFIFLRWWFYLSKLQTSF